MKEHIKYIGLILFLFFFLTSCDENDEDSGRVHWKRGMELPSFNLPYRGDKPQVTRNIPTHITIDGKSVNAYVSVATPRDINPYKELEEYKACNSGCASLFSGTCFEYFGYYRTEKEFIDPHIKYWSNREPKLVPCRFENACANFPGTAKEECELIGEWPDKEGDSAYHYQSVWVNHETGEFWFYAKSEH